MDPVDPVGSPIPRSKLVSSRPCRTLLIIARSRTKEAIVAAVNSSAHLFTLHSTSTRDLPPFRSPSVITFLRDSDGAPVTCGPIAIIPGIDIASV